LCVFVHDGSALDLAGVLAHVASEIYNIVFISGNPLLMDSQTDKYNIDYWGANARATMLVYSVRHSS